MTASMYWRTLAGAITADNRDAHACAERTEAALYLIADGSTSRAYSGELARALLLHLQEAFSEKNCSPIDTTYYVDLFEFFEPKFCFYLLKTLRLGGLNKSTAIPGLNRQDAYDLEIGLPPLAEQTRTPPSSTNCWPRSIP